MRVTMSALIEKGAKTRRVRVKSKPPVQAGEAHRRYKQDPFRAKGEYVVVSISMPVASLVELDALAEECQMSRSRFLRAAVAHFKQTVPR